MTPTVRMLAIHIPKKYKDILLELGITHEVAPYRVGDDIYEVSVSETYSDFTSMYSNQSKDGVVLSISGERRPSTIPIAEELITVTPEQDSPKHILNALSDDCLEAIFKSNVLNLFDLTSTEMVCKRFNYMAKGAIKSRYGRRTDLKTNVEMQSNPQIWQLPEFLRIFGDIITALNTLPRCFIPGDMFGLIEKHCRKIVDLTIGVPDSIFTDAMCALMMRTERLHLDAFNEQPMELELPGIKCAKLVDLVLDGSRARRLSLTMALLQFIMNNQQIKKISLEYCSYAPEFSQICSYLRNLEEIHIETQCDNQFKSIFSDIGNAKPIKRLRTNCGFYGAHEMIHNIAPENWHLKHLIVVGFKASFCNGNARSWISRRSGPSRGLVLGCRFDDFIDRKPVVQKEITLDDLALISTLETLEIDEINGMELMLIIRSQRNLRKLVTFSSRIDFATIVMMLREANDQLVEIEWKSFYNSRAFDLDAMDAITNCLKERPIRFRRRIQYPSSHQMPDANIVDKYRDWLTIEDVDPTILDLQFSYGNMMQIFF